MCTPLYLFPSRSLSAEQDIERRYEIELELINKRQKKEVTRQESLHIQQFKSRLKAVKSQQVRICYYCAAMGICCCVVASEQRDKEV